MQGIHSSSSPIREAACPNASFPKPKGFFSECPAIDPLDEPKQAVSFVLHIAGQHGWPSAVPWWFSSQERRVQPGEGSRWQSPGLRRETEGPRTEFAGRSSPSVGCGRFGREGDRNGLKRSPTDSIRLAYVLISWGGLSLVNVDTDGIRGVCGVDE